MNYEMEQKNDSGFNILSLFKRDAPPQFYEKIPPAIMPRSVEYTLEVLV